MVLGKTGWEQVLGAPSPLPHSRWLAPGHCSQLLGTDPCRALGPHSSAECTLQGCPKVDLGVLLLPSIGKLDFPGSEEEERQERSRRAVELVCAWHQHHLRGGEAGRAERGRGRGPEGHWSPQLLQSRCCLCEIPAVSAVLRCCRD